MTLQSIMDLQVSFRTSNMKPYFLILRRLYNRCFAYVVVDTRKPEKIHFHFRLSICVGSSMTPHVKMLPIMNRGATPTSVTVTTD
jgi:hypothetical protein